MTGFLGRLAAHAQGTAPVLRLRPRSRFEGATPHPAAATAAPVDEPFPDEPALTPDEPADPAPVRGPAQSRPRHPEHPAQARQLPGWPPPDDPHEAAPEPQRHPSPGDRQPDPFPAASARAVTPVAPDPGRPADTRTTPAAPSDVTAGRAEPTTRPPAAPNTGHRPSPAAFAPDPIPFASARPRTAATAPRRPAKQMTRPRLDQAERAEAVRHPAGAAWPTTDEVGNRLTTALRDAGLLAPAGDREAPTVRWPIDACPEAADLDSRLGPATDTRASQGVHLHVHLDRVEVVHPAPPAPAPTPRRPDPPVRRPAPSVDHDAYLARRRQDQR